MEKTALIFIPDISGFTQFVTKTEIKHSKHIISELIEVVLNANTLGLQVSEIEGDAVLFFKTGGIPSIPELIEQSKKMFVDFHHYLKIIDRDNVCQCGACRTAYNLSLKFIAHTGQIEEVSIQNFNKIIGSDVILAHRLLKNMLSEREYLLITENYLKTQSNLNEPKDDWIRFEDYEESYDSFGKVNAKYIPFKELINHVPDPTPGQKYNKEFNHPDINIDINAPILLVHETLVDPKTKLMWAPNIKSIQTNDAINRVNASHTCVFDDLEIHFVTLMNKNNEGEIKYSEEGELKGLSFISDYKLKEIKNGTRLSLKIVPGRQNRSSLNWFQKIVRFFKLRMMIYLNKKNSKKNMILFKNYCEELAAEKAGSSN